MLTGSVTKDTSLEDAGPLVCKLYAEWLLITFFQTLPPVECASPCKFCAGCYTRQLKAFKAGRLLCSVSKHGAS